MAKRRREEPEWKKTQSEYAISRINGGPFIAGHFVPIRTPGIGYLHAGLGTDSADVRRLRDKYVYGDMELEDFERELEPLLRKSARARTL